MTAPLKKIALLGPESSGKTTLCRQLAAYYGTVWVPEFARGYISGLGKKYTLADIEYCAKEQLRSEAAMQATAKKFLFCDTELIIAKVWCEDVFKTVPAWITAMMEIHRYDLFLLTLPDIPFLADDVRENPHRREFFFNWYKTELEQRRYPYEIIGGTGESRSFNAVSAIRRHFPRL